MRSRQERHFIWVSSKLPVMLLLPFMQMTGAGAYTLHNDYSQLFLKPGESSAELIISIPRDEAQKVFTSGVGVQDQTPRNAGGFGAQIPTREMIDAYECTDGKPIDESSLYNPLDPFKNRDPRLTSNVVEFNTQWLGYSYQPHPDTLTVFSSKENRKVSNKDNRAVATFASYTGFLWKKGIEQTWADRVAEDNDAICIRFAEILLTYAEAKIELGEDRCKGFKCDQPESGQGVMVLPYRHYLLPCNLPATNAVELKKDCSARTKGGICKGRLRYMDLIRWRLAEKALTRPVIGFT